MVRAAHPRLLGGHRIKGFDQFRIECCTEADGLRKTRRADGGVSVQTFLMKHHWDAESAVFNEKLLDRIGKFRCFARVFANAGIARHAARVAGPSHLSKAVALFESGLRLFEIKITGGVQKLRRLLLTRAATRRTRIWLASS